MHKLHAILKKAGISLLTAFTVFTNTNMGTLVALAAEPHLDEGEELYQITDGDATYSIKEYTTEDSEVLFALRPETTYSADDQYEAYADDGVGTYLDDNNITSDQQEAIKKIISIGYGTEPNAGNYIASQVLIWQVTADKTYEVDENVAANMEALQARIETYDMDPGFAGQDVTLEGYGEDHAVTLEDASFTGYTEKEIPAGYHVKINDGSLKLWVDEGTEAGTLSFEKKSLEMKRILYKGTNGEFLSLGMEPKEISVNAKIEVPETVEESKDEKVEEKTEEPEEAKADAKLEKGLKATKAAKAPVNNESVGDVRLIDISDVHVAYLKTDNTTMTEGETFQTTSSSLSFNGRLEWKIPNSTDLTNIERVTYQLPQNVELTELSGDVTYKGEVVGTFEIDDSNMLFISYSDDFKKESNRAGWFKFETKSTEVLDKEQSLKFDSGEEFSFKTKEVDPPKPDGPKIGVKKTYHEIKEGDSIYLSDTSNQFDTSYNTHYTVDVYTKDGVNNNVVVEDNYIDVNNNDVAYEAYSGVYRIRITNNGQIKYNQIFMLRSLSASDKAYDSNYLLMPDLNTGDYYWNYGNLQSVQYGGTEYLIEAGLKQSERYTALPTVMIDHLNAGDVLTIDYMVNDRNGDTKAYGVMMKNTATVVSDENPEAPGTGNIFSNYSPSTPLTQQSEVVTYNNGHNLFDKEAEVEGDTVHTTITINGNKELKRFYGKIREIFSGTYDTTTNFSSNSSLEPSDDADFYLDKNSVEVEVTRLASVNGQYQRQTLWSSKNSGYTYNPSVLHGFLKGWNPISVLIPYGTQNQMTQDPSVLAPVITIKYDLKLNPNKAKFSSCSKLEFAGSNTLSSSSSSLRDPSNHSINYSKTVNYKLDSVSPPKVQKTFNSISTDSNDEKFLVWDLSIYVPDTGLTNLVVTDLPSEALTFYEDYSDSSFNNGIYISQDDTVHANPITFTVVTDDSGKQKGLIKIDGRVDPKTITSSDGSQYIVGHNINVKLAFKPGDYTKDPNYKTDENGNPLEFRFTNNVEIDADEIINPCVECVGCDEGKCTKEVHVENVVNKKFYAAIDRVHLGEDLTINWRVESDISQYINDTDEIVFEDIPVTDNFIFDDATLDYFVNIQGGNDISNPFAESSSIKVRDFFDITHDGSKTTLKVKQEYVPQIRGGSISFLYITKATKIDQFKHMYYKNHIDMLVNGEKSSESDADTFLKANESGELKKTAMTVNEFYEEGLAGLDEEFLTAGLMEKYHPVDSDPDSNKSVVIWKMEVDTSKLKMDENTESLTIKDTLPLSIQGVTGGIKQDVFGVALVVKRSNGTSSQSYFRAFKNNEISPSNWVYTNLKPFNIDLSFNTISDSYEDPPYITATLTNGTDYSDLKAAFTDNDAATSKVYMYIFADYIPVRNVEKTEKTRIQNQAELYVDGEKKSEEYADTVVTVEPSIKKSVVYNKDTAPYAEYTVDITLNENLWVSTNPAKIFIEDLPSNNLEILPESFTFDLDIKSVYFTEKSINFTYFKDRDLWVSNLGPTLRRDQIDVSSSNGKTSVLFALDGATTYSSVQIAPGTTLTIKYKAKVKPVEGEILNEKNEISYKVGENGHSYKTSSNLSGSVIGNFFSKSAFVLTDILKKDAKTNTALEGAEFRIDKLTLNAEHTTIVKTETYGTPFTSGTDGHTDTVKLNYDTVYRLVETKTPDGYPTENKVTKYVVFPGHDNIDWSKVSVDGIDYIEVIDPTVIDNDNKVSQATVEIANVKETSRKIILTKKDDKGRILPNATFSLTGDDGSYTEYKTKSDGTLEISNLVRGVTYTLAEKEAPQFYEKNENVITFTISDKGEITSSSIHKYNVNFDGGKGTVTLDDETGDSVTKEIDSGTAITDMPETTAPEGYHFVRWIDEAGNIVDANTVVDQNMHVTAQYERDTHTVTFRTNEGTMSYREKLNVTEIERIVPDGNKLEALPKVKIDDPTKALAGWFDEDGNEVTVNTIINKDMVVTAKLDSTVLQPGQEFSSNLSSNIKHVIFGRSLDYPDITNSIDGINVDENDSGTIKAYISEDTLYVLSEGTIYFNPDSSQLFSNSSCKLEDITFKNIDTSLTTDMHSMFEGQDTLQSIDLRNFETSSVIDMGALFKDCSSLSILKLSHLKTSNVQNFSEMFENCENLKQIDLTTFDTSQAIDFSNMFAGCTALSELNLSQFNSENVVNMSGMFKDCSKLKILDLSSFNTPNVTNMQEMFAGCGSLKELNISSMDTANNPSRTNMFSSTTSLSKIMLGDAWTAVSDSGFSTQTWKKEGGAIAKSGTNVMSGFTSDDAGVWRLYKSNNTVYGYYYNNTLNRNKSIYYILKDNAKDAEKIIFGEYDKYKDHVSGYGSFAVSDSNDIKAYYNESEKTVYILSDYIIVFPSDSRYMFEDMTNLKEIIFENVDTSNATKMSGMFTRSNNIETIDISSFNTSKVTDMGNMFANCRSLASLDLSNFDTSNVTYMGYMFAGCNNLTSLDVSNFNTSKVTSMNSMFSECRTLTSLDLTNFDTSKVTNMGMMFEHCSNLTSLDLSSFDTSKLTGAYSTQYMFFLCDAITTAYARTQADADELNNSYSKPTTWSFVVKP